MSVHEPKTKEEFDALLKAAKGSVTVEFSQEGCGHCDPAVLNGLSEKCEDVTMVRVDCGDNDSWGGKLADEFDVAGTPTVLFAEEAANFTPKKAKEVDPESKSFAKKLKCAR